VPSCTFGASLAAARLHDLVLEQGAPLFIVYSFCCYMQVPLGALLHVWRLTCSCATSRSRPPTRRTSVRRSLVCCCMQLPLGALLHVWRLTCSCATTRSRPEQGAPLFLVHSFVVVCSCPWVPSCTFGASLAAARLHDLVLEQGAPLFIVHSFCCCMQVPLGALLPFWRLTCSCATSRSRPHTRHCSGPRTGYAIVRCEAAHLCYFSHFFS